MPEYLTLRAFSALRWGFAGVATKAIASFATGILLARLLGPKPFGQVAAAMLLFGFAGQLSDAGFSSALIQAPELNERDVRFAFTCQLAIAATLTLFFILIARAAGAAFGDPLIGDIVRVAALVFPLQAFGQISASLLRRRLAFRALQTAGVISSVVGYAFVGTTAALLGAGVWSLVAAQLTQSLTYSALVFFRARHSLVPCWSGRALRLARFGLKVTGANILNWCISNFDNLFVGRAFGPTALGLYSRAFYTVSAPADAVVVTWQQVLFAGCSRLGDRTKALQLAYLASMSAISIITFPVFWSVAICARPVIAGLYGNRWAQAAPLLPPLAIAITLNAMLGMAGPMLSAGNQVKLEVRAQTLSLVVAILAFAICIRFSVLALAWAVLGVYAFRFFAITDPVLRILELRWADVFRVTRGPMLASAVTVCAVWATSHLASTYSVRPAWTLILLAATGTAAASTLLLVAADKILARELVTVASQLQQSLPAMLARKLEEVGVKQANRWSRSNAPPDPGTEPASLSGARCKV